MLTPPRLRRARLAAGLNQTTVGERLGVSQGAVSRWERGAVVPDADQIRALSDLYGVSADWVLGRTDDGGPAVAA